MRAASPLNAIYPLEGIAEPLSAFSHLFAAVIFACLAVLLIKRTKGCLLRHRAVRLYCGSVILLLLVSGVYHLFPRELVVRHIFQRLDHAAIFIVIAGTFTPIHVALFENALRWGMLIVVWSLAIFGALLSIAFLNALPESLCLTFYLSLGWLGIISGGVLCRRFGFWFVSPLLLGALAYTGGAVGDFFDFPVVISGILGPHEFFHFAVIAGLGFHWKFISGFAHRSVIQCQDTQKFLLLPCEHLVEYQSPG